MAGGLGAVASSAAMIHAGLPEGPSLLPLLAAMAIMTTSVGLAGGSWLGQAMVSLAFAWAAIALGRRFGNRDQGETP